MSADTSCYSTGSSDLIIAKNTLHRRVYEVLFLQCRHLGLDNRPLILVVGAVIATTAAVYFSFFLGRRLLEWPHLRFRQLVALGCSRA